MRPRPTNPHVVDLGRLVMNDLRVAVAAIDFADVPLPSIHSREGAKRTVIEARILSSQMDGRWKQGELGIRNDSDWLSMQH